MDAADVELFPRVHGAFLVEPHRSLAAYCPGCGQVEGLINKQQGYLYLLDHPRFDPDAGRMRHCPWSGGYKIVGAE